MKSANSCEQINKSECPRSGLLLRRCLGAFSGIVSLHFESERVHSRGSGSGRFAWPGCGQKEWAGSRLTPRLKARHFQKNTIHPQHAGQRLLRQFLSPYRYASGLQNDRLAMMRQTTLSVQYAQGTLRPCNSRATASHCLILVVEIVEIPDRGQELNSASPPLFCTCPVFFGNKKGVELNAFTYLRLSTAHNE